MSTKIRWFGVLNDASLAPSGINSDRGANVIVIASLTDAGVILDSAYRGDPSRWIPALDLDGEEHGLTPAMSDEITLTLWAADTDTDDAADHWAYFYGPDGYVRDPYPDWVLSIGPRGGIKRERA